MSATSNSFRSSEAEESNRLKDVAPKQIDSFFADIPAQNNIGGGGMEDILREIDQDNTILNPEYPQAAQSNRPPQGSLQESNYEIKYSGVSNQTKTTNSGTGSTTSSGITQSFIEATPSMFRLILRLIFTFAFVLVALYATSAILEASGKVTILDCTNQRCLKLNKFDEVKPSWLAVKKNFLKNCGKKKSCGKDKNRRRRIKDIEFEEELMYRKAPETVSGGTQTEFVDRRIETDEKLRAEVERGEDL